MTCTNCGKDSTNDEYSTMLQLNVSASSYKTNIQSLMGSTTGVEHFNSYSCEKCKVVGPATKLTNIHDFSDFLIIHLVLFGYDKFGNQKR
eukprot:UN01372